MNERDDYLRRIGMVCRISRNLNKMTLRQLSERSGIAIGNLSKLESCGSNITITTLRSIASALGTIPQRILDAAE
jgi:transcriptional regulator with XRE-family HTH domain